MIQDIFNKGLAIAVHRGKNGGSIIENTYASAQCAILSGADIVEFDVTRTLDNKIVLFHSFMENKLFSTIFPVGLMPLRLLKKRLLQGAYGRNSGFKLEEYEEYLNKMKGKCVLNLDRIWCADINKCLAIIDKEQMFNQIIFKSDLMHGKKVLKALSKYKENDITFMAICKNKETLEKFEELGKEFGIKIKIVEAIFCKEDDYFCSEEFFNRMKNNNQLTWVNAINLHKKADMCAMHGDNISITESLDRGWGWLIKKGYNIIQTDWPALLRKYINK
jgi:glycerophosphoryl diester phosphodiesterase